MHPMIQAIDAVSDGIVVTFVNGPRCYFSAEFLMANMNRGSNHVFLSYDPTPLRSNGDVNLPMTMLSQPEASKPRQPIN
jgi:hypothetical protein